MGKWSVSFARGMCLSTVRDGMGRDGTGRVRDGGRGIGRAACISGGGALTGSLRGFEAACAVVSRMDDLVAAGGVDEEEMEWFPTALLTVRVALTPFLVGRGSRGRPCWSRAGIFWIISSDG